jgi:hypothetical protein
VPRHPFARASTPDPASNTSSCLDLLCTSPAATNEGLEFGEGEREEANEGKPMFCGWAEVGQPRVRRPHADVPPPSPPQVEEEASERRALFPASASGALGGGVRALNGGGVGGARCSSVGGEVRGARVVGRMGTRGHDGARSMARDPVRLRGLFFWPCGAFMRGRFGEAGRAKQVRQFSLAW